MPRSKTPSTPPELQNGTPQPDETAPEQTNGPANGNGSAESQAADPLAEAEALKQSLRQTLDQTNRLIASLRLQTKRTRLVESTLASLRQLQNVG